MSEVDFSDVELKDASNQQTHSTCSFLRDKLKLPIFPGKLLLEAGKNLLSRTKYIQSNLTEA